MKHSLHLSSLFLNASGKAFVHAFIPDVYITSSTEVIEKANKKMNSAGCRDEPPLGIEPKTFALQVQRSTTEL